MNKIDIKKLRRLRGKKSTKQIAERFDCTPRAVRKAIKKIGKPKKRRSKKKVQEAQAFWIEGFCGKHSVSGFIYHYMKDILKRHPLASTKNINEWFDKIELLTEKLDTNPEIKAMYENRNIKL